MSTNACRGEEEALGTPAVGAPVIAADGVLAGTPFIPVVLALSESVSIQSMTLTLQALHGARPTGALAGFGTTLDANNQVTDPTDTFTPRFDDPSSGSKQTRCSPRGARALNTARQP